MFKIANVNGNGAKYRTGMKQTGTPFKFLDGQELVTGSFHMTQQHNEGQPSTGRQGIGTGKFLTSRKIKKKQMSKERQSSA
jgi:hypothetical protein